MNLVFFGTPEFALPALKALIEAGYRPSLVVTQPDKPQGRGLKLMPSPVKAFCDEQGLDVFYPEKLDVTATSEIKALKSDVGVLAAYGKLVPQALIDVFPKGILNIHPSLLPKYRGATPVQGAILSGDTVTGVSIMLLTSGLDEGPLLAQEKYPIQETETAGDLLSALSQVGAKLLVSTLPLWISNKIEPKAQDNSQATFTKLIKTENAKLTLAEAPEILVRKVRAYNPLPGAYFEAKLKGQPTRIKILGAKATPEPSSSPSFGIKNGHLALAYPLGTLVITELQLPGKKPISSQSFLAGYKADELNVI